MRQQERHPRPPALVSNCNDCNSSLAAILGLAVQGLGRYLGGLTPVLHGLLLAALQLRLQLIPAAFQPMDLRLAQQIIRPVKLSADQWYQQQYLMQINGVSEVQVPYCTVVIAARLYGIQNGRSTQEQTKNGRVKPQSCMAARFSRTQDSSSQQKYFSVDLAP